MRAIMQSAHMNITLAARPSVFLVASPSIFYRRGK